MPPADKRAVLAHYTNFLEQARASADNDMVRCNTCKQVGPRYVSLERELVDGMNDRPATRQAVNVSRCGCGSDDVEPLEFCITCNIRPRGEGLDECEICFAADEGKQDARVARAKDLQDELNRPFLGRREDFPV